MTGKQPRGGFAASLVIVVGSIGFAPAAPAATVLNVGKASPNASAIIPVNVGDKLGLFAKHGLELKIADFTGGSKVTQALTAGGIDISVGAGTEMALVAKGAPMLAVCNDVPSIPFIGIAVPWDSPVKTIADLKGKNIGMSSAGSLTDWLALQLSLHEGWGPHGVNPVAIGNGADSIVAGFRAHLVDADIAVTSLIFDMEEKKLGRLVIPVSDYVGNLAAGTLFASTQLMQNNPGAVRAFIAGWLDTIAYIRKHKDDTVKIESEITGFPPSVMSKEYDQTIGMFSSDCKFDAESLTTLKQTFVDLKFIDSPPDMSKLFTEAFLPK